MKLRNKKTGEVMGLSLAGDIVWVGNYRYKSLAELNEDWEDYKLKEPLIKDEKIRKAVRAWAEINLVKKILYSARLYGSSCLLTDMGDDKFSIEFVGCIPTLNKDGGVYSIDELCGEEEE